MLSKGYEKTAVAYIVVLFRHLLEEIQDNHDGLYTGYKISGSMLEPGGPTEYDVGVHDSLPGEYQYEAFISVRNLQDAASSAI